MSLAPRLDLRQTQSLVMTPQLQQAIKLLTLSNLEVEAFLAEELDKNPLLEAERGEDAPVTIDSGPPEPAAPEPADTGEAPEPVGLESLVGAETPTGDTPLDMNIDSEDFHQDSAADSMGGGLDNLGPTGSGGSEDGPDFDSFAGAGETLHEHLVRQAGELLSGLDLLIAERIIDLIDENGYLSASVGELAERLGLARAQIETVLAVVQTFDPSGVGSRTLAECIAIQAREADRYDPCMARLIDNLDYLAKGNFAALKRICQVDDEDLADMIRELRGYDPKPGNRFDSGERVDAVVPDVFVSRRPTGWAVELNSASLPRVLINKTYHAELTRGAQDKKSKAWLAEKLADANWLTKTLDQRARTIIKVATEIVKQQEGFFRAGVSHLKPLTLRAVAEEIGMHESTVSRVTSNKYLSCDRGLFELKYFFTSGIRSTEASQAAGGSESASAEAVKSRIKALIAAEDPQKILSDDTLVDLLKAEGFDIARRTVAKYREAIGLGSSVQRRRQKAIGARAA